MQSRLKKTSNQIAKLQGEIDSKEKELEHSDNVKSDQPNIALLKARLDDFNKQIAAKLNARTTKYYTRRKHLLMQSKQRRRN